MREIQQIEAEVIFLTEAEGGRAQVPAFADPTTYRPHVVVGDGEYFGTVVLSAPARVQANRPFIATFGLVYYPEVDYSALEPGVEFSVREGARVVGHGRVLSRWDDHVAA